MWKNPVKPKPKVKESIFNLESLGVNGNGNGVSTEEKPETEKNIFNLESLTVKKKDGGSEPTITLEKPTLPSQLPEDNASRETVIEPIQPIPDFNFINRKGESVLHVGNDPLGSAINNLQSQRQNIIDRNIGADATAVKTNHPIVKINGREVAVTKGSDEVNGLDDEIEDIKQNAFADPNTAKNYLKTKLNGKQVALKKGNNDALGLGHAVATVTPQSDLNLFDQQSLKQNLQSGNVTDQLAFESIKSEQDLSNALASTPNLREAAVKFTASQNPTVQKQIDILANSGEKLPDAYEGQMVSNFLDKPSVIKMAETNPEFRKQYLMTQANLFNDYPTLGKRIVAQKISQAREDLGINNSIINIPLTESTDKIVNDLYTAGKLNDSEKSVYEKSIRPTLGIMQSIGRGIGRLIPGVQAAVDESPIVTPGFFENLENSYVNTLHGAAKSIEDIPSVVNLGKTNAQRLSDNLQNDWSAVSIDPKSAWREFGQATGNMTGFVLPMIMGGAATKAIGLGATASEMITMGLIFEGNNKDKALTMFPDSPGKQYLYTTLSTAGDMMIGKIIPAKEAREGVSNLLNKDITKVVNEFTDGAITASAARNTILEKATNYIGDVVKGNLHTGTAMAGFGLLHNGLDAAFGGRDVSVGDAANEAIQNFKAGFLGGTVISAFAAKGGNQKLNGDVLLEMASNPEHYKEVIENQAKLNPDLLPTKDEKIRNLNESALINKDLQNTDLDNTKKGEYMIQALNEKVWQRKADQAANETLKSEYQSKANESKKIQKDILKGIEPEEISSQSKTQSNGQSKETQKTEAQSTEENGQQIGILKEKGVEVETAPSIEKLKEVKLEGVEQKYKKVEIDDPVFGGKREPMSAQKAKIEYENRHDILTKLIKCLT